MKRLASQLDGRGRWMCCGGVVDRNVKFQLAFFRPAHELTPELVELYGANVLSVTRQLRYEASSNRTIDLGLFVEWCSGCDGGVEESVDGPECGACDCAVPQGSGSGEPDVAAGWDGSFRGGSVFGGDDHPSGGGADPVSAV